MAGLLTVVTPVISAFGVEHLIAKGLTGQPVIWRGERHIVDHQVDGDHLMIRRGDQPPRKVHRDHVTFIPRKPKKKPRMAWTQPRLI